jgi:hypothetical protein
MPEAVVPKPTTTAPSAETSIDERAGCFGQVLIVGTARSNTERTEVAKTTIWHSGCNSWYLDARGVPAVWPWTVERHREEMAKPRLGDYELR